MMAAPHWGIGMFSIVWPIIASYIILLLYLVIAVVLIRKYLRTRDVGLIWLGAAVVIWPPILRWLFLDQVPRYVQHHRSGAYPSLSVLGTQMSIGSFLISLDELQQIFGLVLVLVAVLLISNANRKSRVASDTASRGKTTDPQL